MIGPMALIPGRLSYANMCHPRVSSCTLISSSIFQLALLGREDVRKPPDDLSGPLSVALEQVVVTFVFFGQES